MIHMNPPRNITNYDKRRANSERGGNLGLADLSLEELKTILLERQEAMGLCQHPGGLLKISSTLPSETVEKADFGGLVLLRDPNFLVCHIW
jgi:hypothetical protein